MTRKPPAKVRKQLRQEVGFRCPVEGCGNPYLTWHHFDPPWHVENHHRPEGMIALCLDHAAKADGGAFTDDQLRTLKKNGRQRAEEVRGQFDWMRRDLLAVVGGCFYYEQPHNISSRRQTLYLVQPRCRGISSAQFPDALDI